MNFENAERPSRKRLGFAQSDFTRWLGVTTEAHPDFIEAVKAATGRTLGAVWAF